MEIMKYVKEYIEYKKAHIVGWDRYLGCLKRFRNHVRKELEDIDTEDVINYQTWLKSHYKPATVALSASILRDFFRYTSKRVDIKVFYEEIRRPVVPEEDCEYFTAEEMDSIESTFDEYKFLQLRQLVILRLLRDTGARVSEITNLRISEMSQENHANIVTRKARKIRTIMWSKETHTLLMRYLGVKMCLNEYDYLFEESGKPVSNRLVERALNKAAKKANLSRSVHPHMYRHTKAFRVLNETGNIYAVQQVLGHSNMNSALKYLRLSPKTFLKQFSGLYPQVAVYSVL